MKRILFVLFAFVCLNACSSINELDGSTSMPVNYKSNISVKDYEIKGIVRGEYSRTCILLGLICSGGVYIYDDLIQKSQKLGGNSVVNMVVDSENSSPLWYILFSKKNYRANGLAIKITRTNAAARELYTNN